MKLCPKCEETKAFTEFYKENTPGHGGYNSYCKVCCGVLNKERNQRLKRKVFEAYGGVFCINCGEDFFSVLELDHVNNDGNKERKELNKSGASFYRNLRSRNWPPGYQVLCRHCNFLKHYSMEEYDLYREHVKVRKADD